MNPDGEGLAVRSKRQEVEREKRVAMHIRHIRFGFERNFAPLSQRDQFCQNIQAGFR